MNKKFICTVLAAGVLLSTTAVLQTNEVYADEVNLQTAYEIESEYAAENELSNFLSASTYAATSSSTGKWIKSSNGKWWYKHSDGTYTKNGWEKIDGKWYHFDANGWMQTGWLKVGTKWYYLESTGEMRTGWLNYKDKWYYLLSNGEMNIGWLNRNYKWYYFDSTGAMVTGWKKINGDWYYFLEKGYMNTADLYLDNRFYRFYDTGKILFTQIMISEEKQQKSNWCWAACSAMVGKYKTNSTITQSDIVKKIKGKVIDEGGKDSEIVDAIDYASNYKKQAKYCDPFSFDSAVSEIDKNHPFVVGLTWYNTGHDRAYGHAIVITGYNKDEKSILAIDPAVGIDITMYNYKTLINGGTFLSGSGYCDAEIIYTEVK